MLYSQSKVAITFLFRAQSSKLQSKIKQTRSDPCESLRLFVPLQAWPEESITYLTFASSSESSLSSFWRFLDASASEPPQIRSRRRGDVNSTFLDHLREECTIVFMFAVDMRKSGKRGSRRSGWIGSPIRARSRATKIRGRRRERRISDDALFDSSVGFVLGYSVKVSRAIYGMENL